MALPTSRNTTYAALSQVKSADLNDLQDWIIDHEGRIVDHETRIGSLETSVADHESRLDAIEAAQENLMHSSDAAGVVNCNYTNALNGYWAASAAPAEIRVPVRVVPGQTITAWTAAIRDTGAAVTATLKKAVPGAAPTTLGSAQTSASSSSDQTLSHTLASAEVVVTGTTYWIQIDMPATTMRYYGASYTVTPIP